MKTITILPVALGVLALLTACAQPAAEEALPANNEIRIVAEETLTADIAAPTDAVPAQTPADALCADAETPLYATAEIAAIPSALSTLTAGMTQSTDEMGRTVYTDGVRTVTPFEWNLEGEQAYLCTTDTAAYRLVAQYAPNGKLILITAVPMSTIDPAVCPDAYKIYTELYRYGEEYFGCMQNTEQDGVVVQQMFAPDGAPLFSYTIRLNVYGEAESTALYDAAGALISTLVHNTETDTYTYTDAAGAVITETVYAALIPNECGEWLNDYYGSVYGA